jgi:ribonuclease E
MSETDAPGGAEAPQPVPDVTAPVAPTDVERPTEPEPSARGPRSGGRPPAARPEPGGDAGAGSDPDAATAAAGAEGAGEASGGGSDAEGGPRLNPDGTPRKPRRRGSRGGRKRSKSRSGTSGPSGGGPSEPGQAGGDDEPTSDSGDSGDTGPRPEAPAVSRAQAAADSDAAAQVEEALADAPSESVPSDPTEAEQDAPLAKTATTAASTSDAPSAAAVDVASTAEVAAAPSAGAAEAASTDAASGPTEISGATDAVAETAEGAASPATAKAESDSGKVEAGEGKPDDGDAKAEGVGEAEAATDKVEGGNGEGRSGGRRRRGRGRGGQGGQGNGGAKATDAPAPAPAGGAGKAEDDDRMPELPGGAREGRPKSVKAAAKALVPKIPPPRKPKIGDTIPAEVLSDTKGGDTKPADKQGEGAKRKRRRRRGKGAGNGNGNDKPVEALLTSGVELDEAALAQRKGRERKGRPVGRYSMSVHVTDKATQIAVLEGRALIEHYVSRPSDDISQIHGNIYLGRVQNVLPGMEAAFVDIGTPKNAVLYRGDVHYDQEDVERKGQQPRIEQMLRAGQSIVCQVTKNPIGAKGARLTQEVSLPGRFVVLIPNSSTYGISKRLPDDERKRLRQILDAVKPAQHGIIVRTAAQNVTSEEIEDDVRRLASQWQQIEALAKRSKAPTLLYREPDMAVRVIREEFNQDYRNVQIDDPALFAAVRDYVASISPELADRVEYYDSEKEKLPLFERYHVHEQLHRALDRKVWLPSGGSLIIEHTEALTVIDVNTGKNVGRSSLEETVFKNNMEAAVEIARQLRLRDIGGIIVIDFIDMERKDNRDEVVRVFRDALSRDKTRTQVFDISELGLCEMTRKRIGEGLLESFSVPCPECEARGFLIDKELLPD